MPWVENSYIGHPLLNLKTNHHVMFFAMWAQKTTAEGHNLRSTNNAGSMGFEMSRTTTWRAVELKLFRPRAEVSFPLFRLLSEYKGKETAASLEGF